MAFKNLLTKEQKEKWNEYRQFVDNQKERFKDMSDENLIASAKYYLAQMSEVYEYPPGMPVYNSAFYHAILPELFSRIGENNERKVST